MLSKRIESGEVEGGAEARADDGREGAAPELAEGVGAAGDVAEGVGEGGRAGLLDAGLEEINGLEKRGGESAGAEAGDEVECYGLVSVVPWLNERMSGKGIQDDARAGLSFDISREQ